jgi:uncharacterized protein (TIGR03437 family)
MVTVFGTNLGYATPVGGQLDANGNVATILQGTSVLFDGAPAPLLYASGGQVNAIAPFELIPGQPTQVQVNYQGQVSATVEMPVVAASPGIFAADGSGGGQGLVINQDGTSNSPANPASAGSVIVFYATGAGQLSPQGADGSIVSQYPLPQPILPVSAQIGGQDAAVLYSGGAVGLVEGAIQVNVRIPDGLQPGAALPLVLTIGGQSSQANLTVAVQSPGLPQQALRKRK